MTVHMQHWAGPLEPVITSPYLPLALSTPLILVFLYIAIPYFTTHASLQKYPGPTAAKFTQLWLAKQTRYGNRSEVVHEEHLRNGKFVRIGPKEVSINDPAALPIVYAHGSGSIKSTFYSAFLASKVSGLFNTRDRAEHTRKRKIVSHTFAPKSVREFEPYISGTVRGLLRKWDDLCAKAAASPTASGNKKDLQGWAIIESLDWFNALAFDIIGDLAFGAPFGMIDRDAADTVPITREDGSVFYAPAVQILNMRGEYSATLGCLPPWIRPYMKYIDPWFARGLDAVNNLTGIARTRVNQRLKDGAGDRKDILSHLQNGRDADGNPMGVPELTAEAHCRIRHDLELELVSAHRIGGDVWDQDADVNIGGRSAIMYYLSKNQAAQKKLQEELDATFGPRGIEGVLDFEDVKALPYLDACINEALRVHSTSSMGLPRIMTQQTEVCGEVFPPGTILSVPSYSIHRIKEIWGNDPDEFRPERWLESEAKTRELEKALNIFSYGPRSCVGRNVAMMELFTFISTLCLRYDFRLADPEKQKVLPCVEGFLRKPTECKLAIRRREVS
ncbi:putative Benzoate 4-monooxygenase [Rhodotorula taiwanensis]|uniref:Putative Benzoate 4-monooxygenase n=1 Tax=Rhodotorula taiwanensis TaxID=741276 RepID=A0A2S5BD01_9BASI|nr:putative Benzoate 4-monooxygenase [Rhodotorula taiwanensis]